MIICCGVIVVNGLLNVLVEVFGGDFGSFDGV